MATEVQPPEDGGKDDRKPLTPATRKRLQKCFEHASKQTSQDNFDYATELLTQCVAGDPGNLLYMRSYIENLQKKYGNNKKGAAMAQFKEMGSRSGLKKAAAASNWDDVIRHGLKALTVNPWDIPTLRTMATAAQNITPLGEVELYLLKCALEAAPKDPETNKQCALAMADRGQYDQAIACWHRVEQAVPGNEEAQKAISDLAVRKTLSNLESKKAQMAKPGATGPGDKQDELPPDEVLRRRIAANSKDLQSYYELAQIYVNSDRFKEAEQVYQDALEASDGDPDVREKWQDVQVRRLRHHFGVVRSKRKENEQAEHEYRRVKKELFAKELEVAKYRADRYPTILRYKYDLGWQHQRSGQHGEAIKQYQAARNDPRVKGLCLLGLAQCFQAIKQIRLAKRHYEEAIAEIPDRDADNKKEALLQAGRMAFEERDLDTAEKHLTVLAGMDFTYKDVATLLDKIAELRENSGSDSAS